MCSRTYQKIMETGEVCCENWAVHFISVQQSASNWVRFSGLVVGSTCATVPCCSGASFLVYDTRCLEIDYSLSSGVDIGKERIPFMRIMRIMRIEHKRTTASVIYSVRLYTLYVYLLFLFTYLYIYFLIYIFITFILQIFRSNKSWNYPIKLLYILWKLFVFICSLLTIFIHDCTVASETRIFPLFSPFPF